MKLQKNRFIFGQREFLTQNWIYNWIHFVNHSKKNHIDSIWKLFDNQNGNASAIYCIYYTLWWCERYLLNKIQNVCVAQRTQPKRHTIQLEREKNKFLIISVSVRCFCGAYYNAHTQKSSQSTEHIQ